MSRPGRRPALVAIALVAVLAGLVLRFGLRIPWLANASGAVLYELTWIAVAQLAWPRVRTLRIALAVFAATTAIELLQLSNHAGLVAIRSTLPGRLLLGSNGGFDPADFPLYTLGCGVGFALCRAFGPRRGEVK